jgi:hypothetical protein
MSTALVIFAAADGWPIYVTATPAPEAALEFIRTRWSEAEVAAIFWVASAPEAHQIAAMANAAIPVAENSRAIILRDADVGEARTLIAQLAIKHGVQITEGQLINRVKRAPRWPLRKSLRNKGRQREP